jgi:hypothetical protein
VVTGSDSRRDRLREGAVATGKIILLAMLLDAIYQYIELKTFYPFEALVTAIVLAFVPYVLLRGPAARIVRRLRGPNEENRADGR